ncbi:hypothetical protein H8L32_11505 [Undibacterium sp. CY18W]|uniref:Uncharacterized protein n=1 Tax=Undibacterium hunanense TaxID=2762292 RepID=A0ABR6ZRF9_9BURK|nr:hypothetical protein [Undibacterium hunanense]MBC3918105.1 hypothetical protein [Undibacterium hunanense]
MQFTSTIKLLSGIALLMFGGLAFSQGFEGSTKAPTGKFELAQGELFKAMSDSDKKRIYIIQGEVQSGDYIVIKSLGGKDKSPDASIFNDPKPKAGSAPTITPISTPASSSSGSGQPDSATQLSKLLRIINTCKTPKVFLHIDSYQCLSKEEVAKN